MPYSEESQAKHERIYGQLAALRDSNGKQRGSRKSTTVDGTTVTAIRCGHNHTAFEADQFTGSYSMSIGEAAEYLTTKPAAEQQ